MRAWFLYLLKIFVLHQSLPAHVHLPHVWNIILKGVTNNCLWFTGDCWLNCETSHFNLADGFLKHCSHMLSEKVHLMQLLFPISWITVTNKKDTVLKIWSVFIAVKLLLGCFHTNGDDSRQITNQNRENCSSKVTPPKKVSSISLFRIWQLFGAKILKSCLPPYYKAAVLALLPIYSILKFLTQTARGNLTCDNCLASWTCEIDRPTNSATPH